MSTATFSQSGSRRHCPISLTLGIALAIMLLMPEMLVAQGRNELIVKQDLITPDGDDFFFSFNSIRLNNPGQVFFGSVLNTIGGETGYYLGDSETINEVVRENQIEPDGNGQFDELPNWDAAGFATVGGVSLNDNGQVGFFAELTNTNGGTSDNAGIYRYGSGAISLRVRKGQFVPGGNGLFSDLESELVMNNAGNIAFIAGLSNTTAGASDNSGIYRVSVGSPVVMVRENQVVPGGNGEFAGFDSDVNDIFINDANQVAFEAILRDTNGGESDNSGIFRGAGGTPATIMREGQATPEANASFTGLQSLLGLNNSGRVAFISAVLPPFGIPEGGVFSGAGTTIQETARQGLPAPDMNGIFATFFRGSINNAGDVAFSATMTSTSGGTSDDNGLFRKTGRAGSVKQIAREGQPAPDGDGVLFGNSQALDMNVPGVVLFQSSVSNTAGGLEDGFRYFLTDGTDLIEVVRTGDSIDSELVTLVPFSSNMQLNDFGQVAYQVFVDNNEFAICRFTPVLHWRSAFNGKWDVAKRWTLGIKPSGIHDVLVDPDTDLTVLGPVADTTIRNLQVGGGNGQAFLRLQGGSVRVADLLIVASNGGISGNGVLVGEVSMDGALTPGNSIGEIAIDGNLTFRENSRLEIELAGIASGEFDRICVEGDTSLSGSLSVNLIDDFKLDVSQQFLILEVAGVASDKFFSLSDGDLVVVYDGVELFITYTAGDGNDVALFTRD